MVIGNAKANAMQQGTQKLHTVSMEQVHLVWNVALPIQVEQRVAPNEMHVLATPNPKQQGQNICFIKD